MVRFLYTGSNSYMNDQTDPEKSLGGFCSKSLLPNRNNNLFSDVSYLSQLNETEECKGIVLENNSGLLIDQLFIGYEYDKDSYDIQIAIVELNSDGSMERIGNSKDLPYYAAFQEAYVDALVDNSLLLEDFAIDKKIGIWVKRKIKPKPTLSCIDLSEIVTNISNKNLEFKIKSVTN